MAGKITHVRAAARITKLSKVARVQVTSVALGRNGAAITRNTTPVNSGTAASAVSYSNWVAVTPGVCSNYQARGILGIRWADGAGSTLNILSPRTNVCGPAGQPPRPADRDCPDFATQAQAQAFSDLYYPYYGDFARLDADNDHVACESLP